MFVLGSCPFRRASTAFLKWILWIYLMMAVGISVTSSRDAGRLGRPFMTKATSLWSQATALCKVYQDEYRDRSVSTFPGSRVVTVRAVIFFTSGSPSRMPVVRGNNGQESSGKLKKLDPFLHLPPARNSRSDSLLVSSSAGLSSDLTCRLC